MASKASEEKLYLLQSFPPLPSAPNEEKTPSAPTEELIPSAPSEEVTPSAPEKGVTPSAPYESAHEGGFKVYPRRWYVLVVYSLLIFTLAVGIGSWGPMAATAHYAFGWERGHIALVQVWGPVMFMLSVLPISWFLNTRGLRATCLVSAYLVTAGGWVSCLTAEPPYVTWCANAGQMLISIGGTGLMISGPQFVATWFPTHQQVTALGTIQLIGGSGSILQNFFTPLFIDGSLMYQDKNLRVGNSSASLSSIRNTTVTVANLSLDAPVIPMAKQDIVQTLRNQTMFFLFCQFVLSVAVSILALIHFPDKPPSPPNRSADVERLNFRLALRHLAGFKSLWAACVVFSIAMGTCEGWIGMINVTFGGVGYSQTDLNITIFICGAISLAIALLAGAITDKFNKSLKTIMIVINIIICFPIAWLILAAMKLLPVQIVVSFGIPFAMFISLLLPLQSVFYVLACETAFPVGEGVMTAMLAICSKPFSTFFFLSMLIPSFSSMWLNWALLGSFVLLIPFGIKFDAQYNRTAVNNLM